ncbi:MULTISPECIES: helix-turn-helix domain-containing protein [Pasteurellaceae]|uniref:Helix-turn-helix transcriptional regulator n=1 Tax=Pasteurella atlantica TaxID=2827233 RepID=A0AAW8CSW6_9PAST|nr:helix-turn-helix transcriptional regulator [Pasteurella atlantica]MBR0574589.1 helix-turn-helix transcriptional regulator [Pasteurella atlantica]MDP8040487.1 helix-turn-helix transcriptional regulator [Pasteurella atlantica]MDP8042628.1 helix-turn-helix transcriptional regulator [Pasteurella atlantica]MDP8044740.1 helix-turn-helix transcriptional regulator [Pasteurella atlantica]MDP8046812.1 helix-turn-helix transcriptional regulator [Pasteurella atlantica]
MKVNEKIRMVRETHNWSQEDMADKLAMSTNGYAKIERGETGLHLDKLEKIAKVFDMDLVELLSVSDKSVICLVNENSTNSSNYYGSSQELSTEIEKLKLTLIHKDELLSEKEREIKTLQTLVEALQVKK